MTWLRKAMMFAGAWVIFFTDNGIIEWLGAGALLLGAFFDGDACGQEHVRDRRVL